jgi:hypothetical protein
LQPVRMGGPAQMGLLLYFCTIPILPVPLRHDLLSKKKHAAPDVDETIYRWACLVG